MKEFIIVEFNHWTLKAAKRLIALDFIHTKISGKYCMFYKCKNEDDKNSKKSQLNKLSGINYSTKIFEIDYANYLNSITDPKD